MARPGIIPLRDESGHGVDGLAPFILLAYMCWPAREEGYKRSRVIQYFREEVATDRLTRGNGEARLLGKDAVRARKGQHAGLFVLCACQLFENKLQPTVANVARMIEIYREHSGINAKAAGAAGHGSQLVLNSRNELVENFRSFRAVAHIWAAYQWLADGAENDQHLIQQKLGTTDATVRIMGLAAAIARFAQQVPRRGQDPGSLLTPDDLWWSDLPPPTFPWDYRPEPLRSDLRKALQS